MEYNYMVSRSRVAPQLQKPTVPQKPTLPQMTPGRAAMLGLMYRYLGGLLDPFVTLLEVHKLMYFLQVAGEPLRLQFRKGFDGPYAENLRHELNAIEGHWVVGGADGGAIPNKQLSLVSSALQAAVEVLGRQGEMRSRFERVVELIAGFESAFGLELLSTVDWVMRYEGAKSREEVIARVYKWGDRQQQFSERQIEVAMEVLQRQGWVQRGI